jgi:hypothetical protein
MRITKNNYHLWSTAYWTLAALFFLFTAPHTAWWFGIHQANDVVSQVDAWAIGIAIELPIYLLSMALSSALSAKQWPLFAIYLILLLVLAGYAWHANTEYAAHFTNHTALSGTSTVLGVSFDPTLVGAIPFLGIIFSLAKPYVVRLPDTEDEHPQKVPPTLEEIRLEIARKKLEQQGKNELLKLKAQGGVTALLRGAQSALPKREVVSQSQSGSTDQPGSGPLQERARELEANQGMYPSFEPQEIAAGHLAPELVQEQEVEQPTQPHRKLALVPREPARNPGADPDCKSPDTDELSVPGIPDPKSGTLPPSNETYHYAGSTYTVYRAPAGFNNRVARLQLADGRVFMSLSLASKAFFAKRRKLTAETLAKLIKTERIPHQYLLRVRYSTRQSVAPMWVIDTSEKAREAASMALTQKAGAVHPAGEEQALPIVPVKQQRDTQPLSKIIAHS